MIDNLYFFTFIRMNFVFIILHLVVRNIVFFLLGIDLLFDYFKVSKTDCYSCSCFVLNIFFGLYLIYFQEFVTD